MKLLKIFFLVCLINTTIHALDFTLVTDNFSTISGNGYKLRPLVTDLDSDGRLDLLVNVDSDPSKLWYYTQNPDTPTKFTRQSVNFAGISETARFGFSIVDLDADGLLELVEADGFGGFHVFRQQSLNSTTFNATNFIMIDHLLEWYPMPVFTDFDLDGQLDLLAGLYNGQMPHYEQDPGENTFSRINGTFSGIDIGSYAAPTLVDLDNDGLLDLIIGSASNNALYHYEQDQLNQPVFSRVTNQLGGFTFGDEPAPCFTDLEQDGYLDLLVGSGNGQIAHYRATTATLETQCVSTTEPTILSSTSAVVGGEVLNDNGSFVYRRGVYYSLTNSLPGSGDGCVTIGTGSGEFSTTLTDLYEGKKYFIRTFATNALGTWFGDVKTLTTSVSNIDAGEYAAPAFVDLDYDSKLDLIIGNEDGTLAHYEQAETNSMTLNLVTDNFNNIDVGGQSSPVCLDIDNDGLLDLLVGNQNGTVDRFEQYEFGSLVFNLVKNNFLNYDVNGYAKPAIADIDGDGLIDILVGQLYGRLRHFEQDASDPEIFNLVNSEFSGIDVGYNAAPFFTDLDADGRLDLLVGKRNGEVVHYRQDSQNSLSFSHVIDSFGGIDTGGYAVPAVCDINGNNRFDMLIGQVDGKIIFWESGDVIVNPSCMTTDDPVSETDMRWTLGGSVTDDNGHFIYERGVCYSTVSTLPELSNRDVVKSNCNNRADEFSMNSLPMIEANTYYFRTFAQSSLGLFYGPVKSFTTSSTSLFEKVTSSFAGINYGTWTWTQPNFTDMDGDGLLDLLMEKDSRLLYYEQTEVNSGSFTLVKGDLLGEYYSGLQIVAFADLDGDGLLDLLAGCSDENIRHFEQSELNSTTFVLVNEQFSGIQMEKYDYSNLQLTDIDRDGLLDLIIGEYHGDNVIYEQSAKYSYDFNVIDHMPDGISLPACADINGDGMLDVFSGTYQGNIEHFAQSAPNAYDFYLVNETFQNIDLSYFSTCAFTDIDGDGKLDLITSEQDGNASRWETRNVVIDRECVTTASASSVDKTTAILGGEVTYDNFVPILRRGVCYSTSNNTPTLADSKFYMQSGVGSFSGTVTGLEPGSTYYYRAFCQSKLGSFYGPVKTFTTDQAVQLSVRVFLEGAYNISADNPEMNTDLNANIPAVCPYSDCRDAGSIAADITDWVSLELRSTADGETVYSRSYLLRSDGWLAEADGTDTSLSLGDTAEGAYYIVIRHRNHLAVMSAAARSLGFSLSTYDFSTGLDQYYGGEAALLEEGVFGMYKGDCNGSGVINASDYLTVRTKAGTNGYSTSDANLSGSVNSTDYLVIKPNAGKCCNLP